MNHSAQTLVPRGYKVCEYDGVLSLKKWVKWSNRIFSFLEPDDTIFPKKNLCSYFRKLFQQFYLSCEQREKFHYDTRRTSKWFSIYTFWNVVFIFSRCHTRHSSDIWLVKPQFWQRNVFRFSFLFGQFNHWVRNSNHQKSNLLGDDLDET